MEKDYYKILNVDKGATKDEIKKSFRKLSMKWHPDKWTNGTDEEKKTAEEKFKEISEAYDVLSDDKKRKQYDNPMHNMGGNPFRNEEWEEFRQWARGNRVNVGSDIEVELDVTVKEALFGTKKEFTFFRDVQCEKCKGTGAKDGKIQECPVCHGLGFEVKTEQRGFITYTEQRTCTHCHGKGFIVKEYCPDCNGSGMKGHTDTINVNIRPNTVYGSILKCTGMGNGAKGENARNGDLYIVINIVDCDGYSCDKNSIDIKKKIKVPFADMLLGTEVSFKYLDDNEIKIKVNECTKDKKQYIYRNKGFKDPRTGNVGGLIVELDYDIPDKLNEKQKELLKEFKENA